MSTLERRLVDNRYQVERKIGSGSYKEVYLAKDNRFNADVAFKLALSTGKSTRILDTNNVLKKEASMVFKLNHPNIARVYDCFEIMINEEPRAYFVEELVSGKNLQSILDESDRFSLEYSKGIITKISSALKHSHDNCVIHGDLYPRNVMISDDGRIVVTDYGASVIIDPIILAADRASYSKSYSSGEFLVAEPIDVQYDLFCFGELIMQVLTKTDVATPKEVSCKQLLEEISIKARKPRQGRYNSIDELISDLERIDNMVDMHKKNSIISTPSKLIEYHPDTKTLVLGGIEKTGINAGEVEIHQHCLKAVYVVEDAAKGYTLHYFNNGINHAIDYLEHRSSAHDPGNAPFAGLIFSADGNKVAYDKKTYDGNGSALFVFEHNKSTKPMLIDKGHHNTPVFSPSGDKMAYIKNNCIYVSYLDKNQYPLLILNAQRRFNLPGSPYIEQKFTSINSNIRFVDDLTISLLLGPSSHEKFRAVTRPDPSHPLPMPRPVEIKLPRTYEEYTGRVEWYFADEKKKSKSVASTATNNNENNAHKGGFFKRLIQHLLR